MPGLYRDLSSGFCVFAIVATRFRNRETVFPDENKAFESEVSSKKSLAVSEISLLILYYFLCFLLCIFSVSHFSNIFSNFFSDELVIGFRFTHWDNE